MALEPRMTPNRFEIALRIIATGFCFLTFGVAGFSVWLLVYPYLKVRYWGDAAAQRVEARRIVRWWFTTFIELMRVLGVLEYEIRGLEKLQRPGLLILANHPSLIDVVFIGSLVPRFAAVVRGNLMKNPFVNGPITAAGYVTNDQGLGLVEGCNAALAVGDDVVIFPQGTRTPESGEVKFHRGAANIAIRGRHPITPVVITCTPRGLARYQRWYQVPPHRMHFVINVHDDLQVDPFLESGVSEALAVRKLNNHLEQFFEQESVRAAP
jgi:1-acyl-sn-glycerol-3-phosphate acyltransferase